MWIIEDWTGKRLFPAFSFRTFQDGWAFVYAQFPDAGIDDFDDIYVERAR